MQKKQAGPWGGAVLRRVLAARARQAPLHAPALMLSHDIVRHMVGYAWCPRLRRRLMCVCSDWCGVLRGSSVESIVRLVMQRAMSVRDVCVSRLVSTDFACAGQQLVAAGRRAHIQAVMAQLRAEWVGARVLVGWASDGIGVSYAGEVIGVRSEGRMLRVNFDEGVGKDRLRCHNVPTADVACE